MIADRLALAMLTGLGIGRLRPAPGSIGSLSPVLIVLILVWLLGPDASAWPYDWSVNLTLAALALIFGSTCVYGGRVGERRYGCKDPPDVVADEIAGQSIALLALPWRYEPQNSALIWNLTLAATSYVAFRAFDIFKLPPCNRLQRLTGGWGILADDLVAGLYALIVAQLMARLIGPMMFN
jgi:phosphatidylglycerophosphatase A